MFHVRVHVFLNCDKSKLGMLQAASKVSSVVGLLDVESVSGEVVVLPGYQGKKDHVLVYAAWNRLAEVQMTTRSVWLLYMQDADHGAVRYIKAEQLHPCMMTWLLQRGTDETPVPHRAAWGDVAAANNAGCMEEEDDDDVKEDSVEDGGLDNDVEEEQGCWNA